MSLSAFRLTENSLVSSHRKTLACLFILMMIVGFSRCMHFADPKDKRGEQYAGAQSCIQCHKSIYDNYSQTGHYHTSAPVKSGKDLGFELSNPVDFYFQHNLKVTVRQQADSVYQTSYTDGKISNSHRFDIAFGSGGKAQTYGWWKDRKLYQLPLSYFKTIKTFANSPGFANYPNFDRAIESRCFECHSSNINSNLVSTGGLNFEQELDKSAIIYGIDCERCHGPAAKHVEFHLDHPEEKLSKYITPYHMLNNQQKIDMCGVCHSGNDMEQKKATFTFKPGDTLSNYYLQEWNNSPDVHGKQVQLLQSSLCFIKSKDLNCVSCHSPHSKGPKPNLLAIQTCVNCHQSVKHSFKAAGKFSEQAMQQNCIGCHMPQKASSLIRYQESGLDKTSAYFLTTHKIALYPEETEKIVAWVLSETNKTSRQK